MFTFFFKIMKFKEDPRDPIHSKAFKHFQPSEDALLKDGLGKGEWEI